MYLTPLLGISGLACLFWAIVYCFVSRNTAWFRPMLFLMIALFLTAAGDISNQSTGAQAISYAIVQLSAPVILPLLCLYFAHLDRSYRYRPLNILWIVLPAVLFTIATLLTVIIGLDNTNKLLNLIHTQKNTGLLHILNGPERTYFLWTVTIFRTIMLIEVIFTLWFIYHLIRKQHLRFFHVALFLFRNRKARVLEIQILIALSCIAILCFKVFVHKSIYQHFPYLGLWITLVLAVLYFFFGLFALFSSREYISLKDIGTMMRFNYRPETCSQFSEEVIMDMVEGLDMEALTRVLTRMGGIPAEKNAKPDAPSLASAVFNAIPDTMEEDRLLIRFQKLMINGQLFLKPSLTLIEVADRLHTNKTYVSRMVNQTYKVGFPELLNILRIDYAQNYLREHPEAPQEEVARVSGFLSASTFNSTFKRITGYTPRVWTARTTNK